MNKKSIYPEHEKLSAISKLSQAQGDFIAWLADEKDLCLCYFDKETGSRQYSMTGIQDLLAEYHGIDQAVLENEKRAMLDSLRGMAGVQTSAKTP